MDEMTIDVGTSTLEGFTSNPVIEDPEVEAQEEQDPEVEEESGEVSSINVISSAAYGGFTKILSLLTTNMNKGDVLSIKNGKLSTVSGGGFLDCDLTMLFGDHDIDIIDPQYSIKLMKLISGGEEVSFLSKDKNYFISNLIDDHPLITIKLPKPDANLATRITRPVIGEVLEELEGITPDLVNTISTAEKNLESQYFIIEISEEGEKPCIISISTDKDTFKYNFKEDNEAEPQKFKVFNPFPIAKPDTVELGLTKSESGEYWIMTTSVVGMADIKYMEKLVPMGIFEDFTL